MPINCRVGRFFGAGTRRTPVAFLAGWSRSILSLALVVVCWAVATLLAGWWW